MTKLNKEALLNRYYKLNQHRFYREKHVVKLSRKMADTCWADELESTMYFYYTKDCCLSPFKPTDTE